MYTTQTNQTKGTFMKKFVIMKTFIRLIALAFVFGVSFAPLKAMEEAGAATQEEVKGLDVSISGDIKLLENFPAIEKQISEDLGIASNYSTYEDYKAKTAFSTIVKSLRELRSNGINSGYMQFHLKILGTILKYQKEAAPLEQLLADEKKKEEIDQE